jgi:thiol:disulfide interchange protein DsbA
MRTGVDGTPTIIVNGKYRVGVTPDRGFDGMLATTNWLIAQERAAQGRAAAARQEGLIPPQDPGRAAQAALRF